jgi:hypothetical protein
MIPERGKHARCGWEPCVEDVGVDDLSASIQRSEFLANRLEERATVIAGWWLTKDEREIPFDRVLHSIKHPLARRDARLECQHVFMEEMIDDVA